MHSSIWYIGSKVTTWVAPSPWAASHACFSSSVHIFSVIGFHGWTVAMCSHLPLSAISVSSGEALRMPGLSPERRRMVPDEPKHYAYTARRRP